MNGIGASILVILISIVLGASRRVAILGMMAGALYLTQGQALTVAGFNLYAIRFLELAGFIRVMARREFLFHQLNGIDRALLLLYSFTAIIYCLRAGDDKAVVIGQGVDASLCYFTFRGLIGGVDDFRWFLRAFIVLLVPYVFLVLIESATDHNVFASLGGFEGGTFWTRHGRPRCFGSFRQPDTLGMFAASFIPLYIGLACDYKERKRAIVGICLCLIIAWAANSGGAALATAIGLLGWLFWHWRTEMRKVRWGIAAMITLLALVMNAPIWYIFAHVSSITGGDGWHRSYLIDMAYQHLGKWWFAGMPLKETNRWFPYVLAVTGNADITNQFIFFGLTAGVGAIALLILLLTRAFSNLGMALATARSVSSGTKENEFLLWGLGTTLTVHIVNWFGIAYFDQMYVVWFMQLAAIATLSHANLFPTVVVSKEVGHGSEIEAIRPTVGIGLQQQMACQMLNKLHI